MGALEADPAVRLDLLPVRIVGGRGELAWPRLEVLDETQIIVARVRADRRRQRRLADGRSRSERRGPLDGSTILGAAQVRLSMLERLSERRRACTGVSVDLGARQTRLRLGRQTVLNRRSRGIDGRPGQRPLRSWQAGVRTSLLACARSVERPSGEATHAATGCQARARVVCASPLRPLCERPRPRPQRGARRARRSARRGRPGSRRRPWRRARKEQAQSGARREVNSASFRLLEAAALRSSFAWTAFMATCSCSCTNRMTGRSAGGKSTGAHSSEIFDVAGALALRIVSAERA